MVLFDKGGIDSGFVLATLQHCSYGARLSTVLAEVSEIWK